jgi:hypothetical protein
MTITTDANASSARPRRPLKWILSGCGAAVFLFAMACACLAMYSAAFPAERNERVGRSVSEVEPTATAGTVRQPEATRRQAAATATIAARPRATTPAPQATATRVLPTRAPAQNTQAAPTETTEPLPTSEPPTNTAPPPTSTPAPPTWTPAPPTATSPPATSTPEPLPTTPPTDTPVPAPTAPPAPVVRISYIFYDGRVPRSESDEYAEITNAGSVPVNLGGWHLYAGDPGQDFWFPGFDLQPGQSCRVYTDEIHPEFCGFSFGRGSAIWNNDGDCGFLYDPTGAEVSQYCY